MQWECACAINKRKAEGNADRQLVSSCSTHTHTCKQIHTLAHTTIAATVSQHERLLWHSLSHLVTRQNTVAYFLGVEKCSRKQKLPRHCDCNDWRSHAGHSPQGMLCGTCAGAAPLPLHNCSTSSSGSGSSSTVSSSSSNDSESFAKDPSNTIPEQYLNASLGVRVCGCVCARIVWICLSVCAGV